MSGGKTGTTTQQVQIPAEVMQNYKLANNMMQSAATQPFQTYNAPQGNPNAFVAPINQQQQAGIDTTNMAASAAQPYFQAGTSSIMQGTQAGQGYNQAATGAYQGAYNQAQPYNQMATGLAMAGTGPVNAQQIGAGQINRFMSPYLNTVLGAQEALQNQQNQQQMSGQLGNAINQGAFGGDRAGLAAANLAQQQQIASQNVYANTLNQGYNQALGAAQQQQGVNLGAAQANRAALQQGASSLAGIGQQAYGQGTGLAQGLAGVGQQAYTQGVGTGTTLAGLGTQAQQNLLGAGQAQIGAGTLEQQTQQAGLSALYNQFLQQQGYPFQTAQAVANVAEGTGALSGSTTSTAQPMPFFSDERLKEDIEPIGKTFDGQKIVKFRYKNEPGTRIGLIAQDVEKHHPDAVGLAGGYRTVDYDKATDAAAKRGHFRKGGLVSQSEGGAVTPLRAGQGYADGGSPSVISAGDLAGILQAQAQALGLYGGAGRVPASGTGVGSMGYVPPPTGSVSHLVTAGAIPKLPESTMAQVMGAAGDVTKDYAGAREIYQDAFGKSKDAPPDTSSVGRTDLPATGVSGTEGGSGYSNSENTPTDEEGTQQDYDVSNEYRGGLVRRHRAAGGTDDDPYKPVGPSIPGLAAAAQSDNAPAGLKTPGAPGQGAGGSGVLGAANSALGAINTGKGLFDMAKDIGSFAALALAHGGSAYRHGYDDGGHVSDSGGVSSDSEVPTSIPGLTEAAKDTSDNKLSLPSPPPSSGGGGGGILGGASSLLGLGNALNTATEAGGFLSSTGALADAGSALLAFFSRGGSVNPHVHRALELASGGAARHGYQAGGDPSPSVSLDLPPAAMGTGTLSPDNNESDGDTDVDTPPENLIRNLRYNANDLSRSHFQRNIAEFLANQEAVGQAQDIRTNNAPSLGVQLESLVPNYFLTPSEIAAYNAAQDQSARNIQTGYAKAGLDPRGNVPWSTDVDTTPTGKPYVMGSKPVQGSKIAAPPVIRPNAASPVKKPGIAPPLPAPINVAALPLRSEETGVGMTPGLGGGNPPPPISSDLAGSPAYQKGLAPEAAQPSASPAPAGPTDTGQGGDFMTRAGDWAERQLGINQGKPGTWMDRNEDWLVPLLKGVGTMASSPSRYFGGALLQGVGAGAQSYMDVQKTIPEIAAAKEEATQSSITTEAYLLDLVNKNYNPNPAKYFAVAGPSDVPGQTVNYGGKPFHFTLKANVIPASAGNALTGAGQPNPYINDADKLSVKTAFQSTMPTSAAESQKNMEAVNQNLTVERNALENYKQMMESLSNIQGTPVGTGALSDFRTRILNLYNTFVDSYDPNNASDLKALDYKQIFDKISKATAATSENEAGQRSFGALRAFLESNPNSEMQPGAIRPIVSKMMASEMMNIQQNRYMQEYANEVGNQYGAPNKYNFSWAEGATRANQKYNVPTMENDMAALETFYGSPNVGALLNHFSSASGAEKQNILSGLDKKYANFGPNVISKYVLGGM